MDSLLSNSQRCTRKADSLASYGLFDEAMSELEKSIGKFRALFVFFLLLSLKKI